jgi:UDP-N-acetylglucosamine:LPS N-acetylglucosamine transferase
MDWLTPQLSQSIYSGYQYLIKNYEALYNRYYDQVSQDDNTAQLLGRLIKRKTDKLIAKEMPSLLISTFPICTQVLGEWKENSGSQLPLITVITDVTSATEWLHPAVSHYLVASESVEKELIEKGVAPETISVTGIPVRRAFHRQTGKRLRTCHEPIRLLIMGGGMGLLPEDHTLYRWIQDDPSINATIITGHNHQAYKTLRSAYPALKVKGFVHDIAAEMNQADLLLSKPGGITLFEAIYTEIPILAYRPSLGQEQKNADFIEEKGIGQRVMATGEILKAIDGYRETYTLNRVHAQMESLHQELNQRNDQAFDQLLEKHVNG